MSVANAFADNVAKIGATEYETLQAAINAVPANTETTITLVGENAAVSGNGFQIPDGTTGKNIIIDFNGCTYTVTGGAVGSNGTINQCMHFYKDNKLTLRNGTIKVQENLAGVKIMMQNYCDLTLDNLNVDCSSVITQTYSGYTGNDAVWNGKTRPKFNFNSGTSNITNSTITFSNDDLFGVLIDLEGGSAANLTIGEGTTINGNVTALGGNATINAGTITGNVSTDKVEADQAAGSIIINGGTIAGNTTAAYGTITTSVGTPAQLKAAIEGLGDDNHIIKLTAKITLEANIAASHSFTLDLGSYSITKGDYSIALADEATVSTSANSASTARSNIYSTPHTSWEICRKKTNDTSYSFTPAEPEVKFTGGYFATLKDAVEDAYYTSITFLKNVTMEDDIYFAVDRKGGTLTLSLGNYTLNNGGHKIYMHKDVTAKLDKETENSSFASYDGEVGNLYTYEGTGTNKYCYVFCNENEAKIGETEYATFALATASAGENDVITLLRNVLEPYTMTTSSQTLKVKKDGYSITIVGYEEFVAKSSTADGTTTYTQTPATVKITNADNSVSYSESLSLLQANGTTLTLLKDYSTTSWLNFTNVYSGRSITLDLGGHTLSVNTSAKGRNYCINLNYNSTLTVKNGTIEMTPTSVDKSNGIFVDDACSLIVEPTATIRAHGVSAVTVWGTATLETAGTLYAENDFVIAGNGTAGNGGYNVTIAGGSVTSDGQPAIYHPNTGTVTISDGEITGATAIYQKCGTLNITGGTITGNGTKTDFVHNGNGANATGDAVVIENCGYPGGAPAPSITGGTFISTNAKAVASYAYGEYEPVTGFISAGTFNSNVDASYLAEGLGLTQDGNNYVVAQPVAKIGNVSYATLQAAINAVPANTETTITLVGENAAVSGNGFQIPDGTTGKNIIIDFNGCTYTVTGGAVGSNGTINQCMHFYKDNKLTLRNGTIKVQENLAGVKIMMQNYCDLTLDNLNVDCSSVITQTYSGYTGNDAVWNGKTRPKFNFNSGTSNITNSTITFSNDDLFGVLIDLEGGSAANLTIGEGTTINGNVTALGGNATINAGTITGNVSTDKVEADQAAGSIIINGGTIAGNTTAAYGTITTSVGTPAQLKAAIEGLGDDNHIIKLTAKITLEANIAASHSFTLDLGSYSITKGDYSIALADEATVSTSANSASTARSNIYSTPHTSWEICRKKTNDTSYSFTPAEPEVKFTGGYFATLKDAVEDAYYTSITFLKNVTMEDDIYFAVDRKGGTLTLSLGNYTLNNGGHKIYMHKDVTAKLDKETENSSFASYDGEVGNLYTYEGTGTNKYCYVFCNENEAKIGETEYATFALATASAGENDVITLLRNVLEPYTMTTSSQTLKVKKDGYSITIVGYEEFVAKSSTADGTTTYTQTPATVKITNADNSVSYSESLSLLQANGTTLTLLKDYSTTSWLNFTNVYSGRSITLDLGGHTLSVNTSAKGRNYCINLNYNSTLTVKNGTIEMTPTSVDKSNGIFVDDACSLIVEPTATIRAHGVSAVTVWGTATLETAGTLYAENDFVIAGNGTAGNGGYNVTIAGGSVTSDGQPAIYHPNTGTVTISDGEITGATAIYQKCGTLNITGGTITGNGTKTDFVHNGNGANATGDAVVIENCGYPGGAPAPSITGGTFISTNAKAVASYAYGEYEPVTGFISGGTFNSNVDDYCADGYAAVLVENLYKVGEVSTGEIVLTDGETVYNITSDTPVNSVTYKRTFPENQVDKYMGWFVPFDYTVTEADAERATFYKIDMIAHSATQGNTEQVDESRIWIHLKSVTAGTVIKGNKPYLVKPLISGDFEFTGATTLLAKPNASDVLLSASTTSNEYNFHGTYSTVTQGELGQNFMYMGSGQIHMATLPTTSVRGFRWYITISGKAEYARIAFVEDGEETTAIQSAEVAEPNAIEGYYTLNGVKVEKPGKGVYVVKYANGQVGKIRIR